MSPFQLINIFTANIQSRTVVLKLYKHTKPLCSFPSFCQTPFLSYIPYLLDCKPRLI